MSTVPDSSIPIVVDSGSSLLKAGLAGEKQPSVVLPCVFGRNRSITSSPSSSSNLSIGPFVGEEALQKRKDLRLVYPVEDGIVTDWDKMEKIWHHTFFNSLGVSPYEHPVMLTESVTNPKVNRAKMTEIMFETFGTPSLSIQNQAVLSLYSIGKTTGVVIESGHASSHIVPVYEGFTLFHAVEKFEVSGKELNRYLDDLIAKDSRRLSSESIQEIKEKHCFVAESSDAARQSTGKRTDYLNTDGRSISLRNVASRCCEPIFDPFVDPEGLSRSPSATP